MWRGQLRRRTNDFYSHQISPMKVGAVARSHAVRVKHIYLFIQLSRHLATSIAHHPLQEIRPRNVLAVRTKSNYDHFLVPSLSVWTCRKNICSITVSIRFGWMYSNLNESLNHWPAVLYSTRDRQSMAPIIKWNYCVIPLHCKLHVIGPCAGTISTKYVNYTVN